jgi:predicted nucleic acid-binding protein
VKTYLDSSFLFSLYVPDQHSSDAAALLGRTRGELLLSTLTELELANAIELRVFRKELTRTEANRAHAAFQDDLRNGVLKVRDVSPEVVRRTVKLILQHTQSLGCRTADIVHVAAALDTAADRFFTFDQRQTVLAKRAKLSTN